MSAIVEGEGVGRVGKSAISAFSKYKARLSPEAARYAEAYWRSKRREAVSPPTYVDYGIPQSQAMACKQAVESILQAHSHR